MEIKDRILQKANDLFSRYGVKSVTMDEIATQLGISKKTIYLSFADKDELVFEVFNGYIKDSQHNCLTDQKKAENAIHELFLAFDMTNELLTALNTSILYDLEKYHPAIFKKFKEFKNEFLYKVISENLKRGIKEDYYRQDFDVDILTRLRLATIMLSFNQDIFQPNKYNILDIERELILHFMYGIASAKGIKLIQKYLNQRKKIKA